MALAAVMHAVVFLPCLLCFMALGLEKFQIGVRDDFGPAGGRSWNNGRMFGSSKKTKYQRSRDVQKLGDVNNIGSLGRFDTAEEGVEEGDFSRFSSGHDAGGRTNRSNNRRTNPFSANDENVFAIGTEERMNSVDEDGDSKNDSTSNTHRRRKSERHAHVFE